jgi:Flp pilus assembly pilin Flp
MLQIQRFLDRQLGRIQDLPRQSGQTLVEYGMIVMLLAIVSIAILTVMGQDVVNLFTGVSSDFKEIESQTP